MACIINKRFVDDKPVEFWKSSRKNGIADAVVNFGVPIFAQVGDEAFGVPLRKILKHRIHHLRTDVGAKNRILQQNMNDALSDL